MDALMLVQPCFRLARAVVFATVCLTLTTAGHAYAAGACVPPPFAVAAGFVLVTGLALALCGAERSFWTIGGLLAGAQFALHALFAGASAGAAHPAGEAHVLPAAQGGGGMTLAHLGAALATAWWLRRGEAAMWSLARRVSAAAGRPWRPIAAASPAGFPAPPACRTRRPDRPASDAPLRRALVRGPPAR
ncbi:hypothetical protein [Actinomadura litoris]|uniref:hypothetical protein n=1 Tax=Actinomadura litoris TaxID=2678616 RepID=UPI001FA728D0|nr:hypothetical protein [Actinomadura litoris]